MVHVSKPRLSTAVLCVILALILTATAYGSDRPDRLTLTILYTNDVHGHLFPFDYDKLGKLETDVGGAARRAALIRRIKSSIHNPVLVMDAGDTFTRGPLQNLEGAPDFDVMNAVPYDVMTLGNNEFKGDSYKGTGTPEGLKITLKRIQQARFPLLSANVFDASTGKTLVQPYHMFDCGGVRVGVFGVTTRRVAGYPETAGLRIDDPISTAKRVISELESRCDFIIGLTHIGYPYDLELARAIPGIDVIIGGDTHTWIFQPQLYTSRAADKPGWWVGGTIICQAGEWGKCVGRLDVSLRLGTDHRYRVSEYTGELIDVGSSIKPAEDIERIIAGYAQPFTRPIGKLKTAVPLKDAAAWVAERLRVAAGTQVGVAPRDEVENGLRAGGVTELDIRRMMPFDDKLLRLSVTGKQLRNYVTGTEVGMSGARWRDGELYIGEEKASDSAIYTLVIADYYAINSPILKGAASQSVGIMTREAVAKYISR
ncbi:MAG: metallophosphoesterase [Armatimonadetes bacterium]|nr:metallophosphoesterase [Armatimonadota bacterium]